MRVRAAPSAVRTASSGARDQVRKHQGRDVARHHEQHHDEYAHERGYCEIGGVEFRGIGPEPDACLIDANLFRSDLLRADFRGRLFERRALAQHAEDTDRRRDR